jgi:pimeloyl-ACP methyl ester carboxylesterase
VRALPKARLAIYPDAGHAFLFQHADQFAQDVTQFLSEI